MASSILLLLSTVLYCAGAHDIHKRMTIEELKSTFHVDSHDLVPDYEVVHIHHISTRSISSGAPSNNKLNIDNKVPSVTDSLNLNLSRDSTSTSFGRSKIAAHSKISESTGDQKSLRGHKAELRLSAFGQPMNLSLVRTEGLIKKSGLKVWTVEPNATAQHGVEYIEIPQTSEDIGDIYQDEHNQAAILLRNDENNGELLVDGSIGSSLVIKPIPTRLRKPVSEEAREPLDLSDDEMYLDQEDGEGSEVAIDTGLPIHRQKLKKTATRLAQHVVFKRKKIDDKDEHGDFALMEPDHLAKRYRRKRSLNSILNATDSRSSRSKREAPYIIYPEILVIVDYDGYRLHDGDNVKIKRYFVSFWNGVDLRYKLLKGPKIRISIAGIIISRGRDATPYLERNRVGRDAIDSAAALTDMGKYLFRERRLPVYDIAVAITKYDMCRRRKGGRCTKGTAGFAYVGGACVVNKRLEKVNSVAIIEDTGGFSGIIVAAHEVGHLLGAVHDGSPPPSYLGGPGAEKCRWEDGYIMSDLRHTERGFRWSPCSVASFHHFLNGDTATCLYNAPHEDDSLPRVLPGKLLSLDAQCRKDRGTSACFKDDRVCAQLFCFDAGSGYCVAYRPAAEGSTCGDGQYCLNGRCVAEHENIIPDYSQNTPSYIRRQDENQGRPLFHDEEPEAAPPEQQYYQPETTQNPYNQYQPQQYPTTTTENPYYTTQNPYYTTQNRPNPYYTTQQQQTTRNPYNYYSTTTKQPSFNYGRQSYNTQSHYYTSTNSPYSTTRNPYIGDYYNLRSKTTKSPYDFANFGRTTKQPYYQDDVNNNYLKRSYNSASYFAANSNNRYNITFGSSTARYG